MDLGNKTSVYATMKGRHESLDAKSGSLNVPGPGTYQYKTLDNFMKAQPKFSMGKDERR